MIPLTNFLKNYTVVFLQEKYKHTDKKMIQYPNHKKKLLHTEDNVVP